MEFVLLASAHFIALLSPGPDFFLILQAALRLPLRFAVAVCVGIAAANGVYLFCALAGFEAMVQMNGLMSGMRYLGAVYLIFIGIMLLKSPRHTVSKDNTKPFLHAPHLGRQFCIGFMSAILNPKNAVFYLSLFTVIVSAQTPSSTRCLYALWMTGMVLVWDCFVVAVISRRWIKETLGQGVYYLEKAAGAVLATIGLILPFQ